MLKLPAQCSLASRLTDYSEVEGGLSQAAAVLELDGVAAAVLLLSFCNGQLTAAVCAHYRDALTFLNLKKQRMCINYTNTGASCRHSLL